MDVTAEYIDYSSTGYFSRIITDYLAGDKKLEEFYQYKPSIEGIQQAISDRQQFPTNRTALIDHLTHQYKDISINDKVKNNLHLLSDPSTFTVCTAHQPNIFTGHLYFIYKILHTIKIADFLKQAMPENNFVPVFYMGNEDADLEELGHIYIDGTKYEWNTNQTGAVGRMLIDDKLVSLIKSFTGQVAVLPFGKDILQMIETFYVKGIALQDATLQFVNKLFESYGLIVLIPDSAILKTSMIDIFKDDLLNHIPEQLVLTANKQLEETYKAQAQPRDINLFYIADHVRNKIMKVRDQYFVENTNLTFTKDALLIELNTYPERFSPNVILRGLYQEMILPNLAFIGGGGELAYWLQLRSLFNHYKVPYPVLVLRNSFVLINKKIKELIIKLQLSTNDLFKDELTIINQLVLKYSQNNLHISEEKQQLHTFYASLSDKVSHIDHSLKQHIEVLEKRSIDKLNALEKKMLRAERRKYKDQLAQVQKIRSVLFPHNNLQERIENVIPFYGRLGNELFTMLYEYSGTFEQQFCVLQTDHL